MIMKEFSGDGVDREFLLVPDDLELLADGADCTRVAMRVTDQFDNVRPLASDPIVLTLEGPGELIGDNPFALVGGRGAVWIRSKEVPGTIRLRAKHPRLGEKVVEVRVDQAPPELV